MSAPVIEGQKFPEYEFTEYPKVVYLSGEVGSMNEAVHSEEEEAEAAKRGFTALGAPRTHDPVAGFEFQGEPHAPPAATEPQEAAEAPVEALPEPEEPVHADEPEDEPVVDGDGDGHDDETGEFVSPNPGRRGKK